MKIIYITEEQKNAIDKSLLLELSNRAIQREIESAIREYCAISCSGYPIKQYLDTPLSECPRYIRQVCDPSGNGQMWRSVANNQTGANKFIDFLRLNFLSQFNIGHNSGPKFFAPGLARISMGELGFYSFNPDVMRGGDITTLGNIAMIIANKPDLIDGLGLDEYLNGMSFEEFKRVIVPKIKAFKKQENDNLDSMEISANDGHHYEIIALNDTQYNYAQRTPDATSKRLLQSLSQYTDWCICGTMGDMEYAQYVSNGSKFYICLRDDYKAVQRKEEENCPLDNYGLSMIAVKVAPDGLPDNVTTRWNHDNGGENNQGLWLATQLQKILGVKFKDVFKPRSSEELRQMNVGGAGELDESVPSAQDQVHGKSRCLTPGLVDGGIGGGVMEENGNDNVEIMYRGYDSKFGEYRDHLLWLTSDLEYAKEYGDTVAEYKIDITKTRGSIFDIGDDDYIDGPSEDTCKELLKQGINSYWFDANNDESECLCLWSTEPIISKRIMSEGAEPESNEYGIGFEGDSSLEYGHVTEDMKYMHGATPHKELPDFKPNTQPLIMYKQFKLRLNKNGENLAPGYVFPLYVNTEDTQNGEKPSGLKIGKWYKSGEGECWLDTNNNRLYTRGKGYSTDNNTIDKLAYRPGWHLTTTPWGNQRGVNKVTDGKTGTGNNYRNMRDSEVWAKVEICVDVDATERARARSKNPAGQCLDKLNDREFYKYKTNGNATDDQAWYIVDTIRIIEILDDDSVDSINDKYYQELLQNNPSKKINNNPEDYTKDNVDDIPYWKMPRANGIRYSKDDLRNMGYEPSEPTMLNENTEAKGYDFKRDMKSIAAFMRSEGLNIYPYPKVKLNWEDQDGLFIRTGYYEPHSRTIVLFCNGRHPKDILRTYAHEMIHHSQNLDGKDLNFETSDVKDDDRLEKIESEAYVKGNIYFRKWTEHMRTKETLNENKVTDSEKKAIQNAVHTMIKNGKLPKNETVEMAEFYQKIFDAAGLKFDVLDDNFTDKCRIADEEARKFGCKDCNAVNENILSENVDYESVIAQAPDDKFPETLDYGVNVNIDERDWLELIFRGEKTIATCGERSYKQWKKHTGEMIGLIKTTRHPSKDNPSGVLVGYARLASVKQYTDYNFNDDYVNHRVSSDCEDAKDRCGLVLVDVHELKNDFKVSHETETVRPLNYPSSKSVKNNLQKQMNESLDADKITFMQEKMWRQLAVDNYGLTDDFNKSGFILTDGTLLDITDAENHRNTHNSIDVLGINKNKFMELGEIRVQPQAPGLEIHKRPTKEQYAKIEEFIEQFKRHPKLYFDCNQDGRERMVSTYKNSKYGRILDDIKNYFSVGTITQTDDFKKFLEEGLDESMNPEDVDLTSFNIKKELNPKFWKDERLDSRIRMRLLDISDDFIEYLGVDWVKPDDVIMTGSLANFNWNKKYSDIDLHILIDFSKVDKRRDFVKQYFDSKKNLWNEEHRDLKIFGFPIEVYVQDTKEKHSSTGVYSLDKDKWICEPERKKLSSAKVNKQYIKNKVSEYIDEIDKLLTIYKKADGDEYKIRKISEKADVIFKSIKNERTKGLEKSSNEISNGNIIFKCLRRMGYIDKIYDLKSKTYDNLNSLV